MRRPLERALLSAIVLGPLGSASIVWSTERGPDRVREAVAAPNVRFAAAYGFSHVDGARSSFSSANVTQTLHVGETDLHSGKGQLFGTFPVYRILGLRTTIEGGYDLGTTEAPLTGESDQFDSGVYGGSATLFVRDPGVGAVSAGATFERVDHGDGSDENRVGGTGSLAAFFPDLGAGPVDWTLSFRYRHAALSGTSGVFGSDGDSYSVGGLGGWYPTSRSLVSLGGSWVREKRGALIQEDGLAIMDVRWLLPVPVVSIELDLEGSVGESEFKVTPFPPRDRFTYAITLGVQIRQITGKTLVELRRGYD